MYMRYIYTGWTLKECIYIQAGRTPGEGLDLQLPVRVARHTCASAAPPGPNTLLDLTKN
jgi:hypothetical protein